MVSTASSPNLGQVAELWVCFKTYATLPNLAFFSDILKRVNFPSAIQKARGKIRMAHAAPLCLKDARIDGVPAE